VQSIVIIYDFLTFLRKRESYGMGEGEEDFVIAGWCVVGDNCGRGISRHAVFNFRRKGHKLAHEDAFDEKHYLLRRNKGS
jgi:hypothetical protein